MQLECGVAEVAVGEGVEVASVAEEMCSSEDNRGKTFCIKNTFLLLLFP